MREPPASRYRVVERGRRLVVLDTWNGNVPVTREPSAPAAKPSATPRSAAAGLTTARRSMISLDQRGRTVLSTMKLYDERGPRRLVLDAEAEKTLQGAKIGLAMLAAAVLFTAFVEPLLLILPVIVLVQPKPRAMVRGAITRWLNKLPQAADDASSVG